MVTLFFAIWKYVQILIKNDLLNSVAVHRERRISRYNEEIELFIDFYQLKDSLLVFKMQGIELIVSLSKFDHFSKQPHFISSRAKNFKALD